MQSARPRPEAIWRSPNIAFAISPAASTCSSNSRKKARAPASESAHPSARLSRWTLLVIDTVPLTGVGKVFKPQLRWDASTPAIKQKVLLPLREKGMERALIC